jgi:hypothetical protein
MIDVRRALRWKPGSYRQVWLIDAASCGLVVFVIVALFESLIVGLVAGVLVLIARGAVQSYRLDRRRDAGTVSEWTSAGTR